MQVCSHAREVTKSPMPVADYPKLSLPSFSPSQSLGVTSKFQRVHFVDNFNMHANLCQLTLYIIYTGSVFAHSLGPSQPNGVLFNPLLVISRFTRFTWNRSVAVPTMGEWWYRWYAFNSHAFGSDVCHRWILTFKNPSCLFYSGSCCTFVAWGKMPVKYRRG